MRLKTSTTFIPGCEVLVCPQCGFEYVQIYDVASVKLERGTKVTLAYLCENHHKGRIVLHFHKGNTLVEHEELPFPKNLPI